MQFKITALLALLSAASAFAAPTEVIADDVAASTVEAAEDVQEFDKRATVPGFDVSHYQGCVNMATQKSNGARFVMIKATEGTSFVDDKFNCNYAAATKAGLIRGGYHFARPSQSSGAAQAKHFLAHGGKWSGDGKTLPGMLDLEYNPSGSTCYGLSHAGMKAWIADFGKTYKAATGRYPMIYTTTDWWTQCTGNTAAFASYPLDLARYSSSIGSIPNGMLASFWQFADKGKFPGDQQVWRGSLSALQTFAKNAA